MAIPFVAGAGRFFSGGAGGGGFSTFGKGANIANTVTNVTPKLEESCRAIVYGNPDCSQYSMYWLCVSIVFAFIRRRDINKATPPSGLIMVQYDPTQNYMCFEARQSSSYAAFATTLGDRKDNLTLFVGPLEDRLIEGGRWQWNSLLPKLPGGPGGVRLDKLGWENRTIFTPNARYSDVAVGDEPAISPVPPGDETSRGVSPQSAELFATGGDPENWNKHPEYLLYAALEAPCSTDGKVVQKVDTRYVPIPEKALTTPPKFPSRTPDLSPGEEFLGYSSGGEF